MALIKCPECGKEISESANSCPVCGYPIKRQLKKMHYQERQLKKQDKYQRLIQRDKEFLNKNKRKILVGIIGGICITASIFYIKCCIEYQKAINAYNSGEYKIAYEYFKSTNKKEYIDKSLYGYIEQLLNENDIDKADQYFELLSDTEKKELEPQIVFSHAIRAYELGDFKNATELFKKVKNNSETEKYLNICEAAKKIQGEWILKGVYFQFGNSNKQCNFAAFVIDGWNATFYYCTNYTDNFILKDTCKLTINNEDNSFEYKTSDVEYKIEENTSFNELRVAVIKDNYFQSLKRKDSNYMWNSYGENGSLRFTKGSIESIKNDIAIVREPFIGMKKTSLENSTWGKPTNINKRTYSWGVTEQWCYPNNKYIYLENNIVTSISE